MKFVIVEDDVNAAPAIAKALNGMGEIVLITTSPPVFKPELKMGSMPTIEEVLSHLEGADVVILDHDLKTNYTGKDLLQYCEGKKVVGISSTYDLGEKNFYGKQKLDRPERVAEFRALIEEVIAS